jgi:hypothetical protein
LPAALTGPRELAPFLRLASARALTFALSAGVLSLLMGSVLAGGESERRRAAASERRPRRDRAP